MDKEQRLNMTHEIYRTVKVFEIYPGWFLKKQDRFELSLEKQNPYISEIDSDGWYFQNNPDSFKEVKMTTNLLDAQNFDDEMKEVEKNLQDIFKNSKFVTIQIQLYCN